jgi:hypothetical protein
VKEEEKNKNEIKKENKAFGLIDELEDSKRKEGQKSMEKNNVLVDNEKESDEKANIISKKINENQNQNLFNFNNFDFTNKNNNKNNLNSVNNNIGFNFSSANFTNPKNSSFNQENPKNNSTNFNFGNLGNNSGSNQNNPPNFNFDHFGNNSGSKQNNPPNFNFGNFGFNNNNTNNNQFGFSQQNNEGKIQVELNEEVCFYYKFQKGNQIQNVTDKGYLGLKCEKEINQNRDFRINFLSQNFNNPQYIQREDSKVSTEKINDFNYKMSFPKMKKSEKLLGYIINPNILVQNRILEPLIAGENNVLKFQFIYNTKVKKNIKKIDLSVIYKNMIVNNSKIQCDGNIINNTNNQIIVSYNEKIKEAKIIYPLNINVFNIVAKITIVITLENDVMSEFDVEVIDLKTNVPLQNVKNAEISYEFS